MKMWFSFSIIGFDLYMYVQYKCIHIYKYIIFETTKNTNQIVLKLSKLRNFNLQPGLMFICRY